MGALHYDHASHHRTIYELHASAEESGSCARDGHIHIRWYGSSCLLPWDILTIF